MFAHHRWFLDEASQIRTQHHCVCGVARVTEWPPGSTRPLITYWRFTPERTLSARMADGPGACPRRMA